MTLQKNVWYVCSLGHEVDRDLRRRVIAGEPVLLYRTEAGEIVALRDQCPHRFAPLSRGKLIGDVVQCGYHGLQFDRSGQCVYNPHGDVIAPNAKVRSFPVVERHGLVWLWLGDPRLASPDTIPGCSYMSAPDLKTVHSYFRADYRYDILVDNLLDLSHADYLHVGSFKGGVAERSETKVSEDNNEVHIVFTQYNIPAPPFLRDVGERINEQFRIHWHPGQVITFEGAVAPQEADFPNQPTFRFAHIATPETEETTHYFMSITRDHDLENPQLDREMADRQVGVIQNEDGPMLLAVQAEMAGQDLLEMRPVILPTDTGALRVRRIMKRLIAAEANDDGLNAAGAGAKPVEELAAE